MKVVAAGCSWGGLHALSTLLRELPAELDAALVIAQHRAPEGSVLETLLQERCALPLDEAEDKMPLETGRVYLAPPAYHLLVERGHLALSTDAPVQYARPSLDVLFESAADAYGAACVGVVLTGAGADGAEGLARIAAAGGAAVVQDPDTAERPEMPSAARAAVPTAAVLPLERIAEAVVQLVGTRERV